jgi:hypothetical protein
MCYISEHVKINVELLDIKLNVDSSIHILHFTSSS